MVEIGAMLSVLELYCRQISGMRNFEGRSRLLQALLGLRCGLRRLVEMAGPVPISCPTPSIIFRSTDDSIMGKIWAINNLSKYSKIAEERQIESSYRRYP